MEGFAIKRAATAKTVPSAIVPPTKHCNPIYDPFVAEISAIFMNSLWLDGMGAICEESSRQILRRDERDVKWNVWPCKYSPPLMDGPVKIPGAIAVLNRLYRTDKTSLQWRRRLAKRANIKIPTRAPIYEGLDVSCAEHAGASDIYAAEYNRLSVRRLTCN